jgi:hypothetical protein
LALADALAWLLLGVAESLPCLLHGSLALAWLLLGSYLTC